MSDRDRARRLLTCLDLTDLSDSPTEAGTDRLCTQARGPHGPVAAVCVWPQMVSRARAALAGSPVRVATVANFPHGRDDLERVLDDVAEMLRDGAEEIDLVLPYQGFLKGERRAARALVEAVRDGVRGRVLKLILETGVLAEPAIIAEAARLGIAAGVDFLKTSTGKTAVSATPEAARILLETIRASDRPVGLKVSGGVRTSAQAAAYLDLAETIMGPGWAVPRTFRIGASALHADLVGAIEAAER